MSIQALSPIEASRMSGRLVSCVDSALRVHAAVQNANALNVAISNSATAA
jgi:hypothetical protein